MDFKVEFWENVKDWVEKIKEINIGWVNIYVIGNIVLWEGYKFKFCIN